MTAAFFVFILGTIFGSFASAILHRTRYGGSVFIGRSKCVSCKNELGAADLVPVVSYLLRRGKCRLCRAPVSWQYLALELGMGALFVAAFYRACGWSTELPELVSCSTGAIQLMAFAFFLALVFVYDARHGEIPDAFSVSGTLAGFILNLAIDPTRWAWLLLGSFVGAAFFGAQYLLGRGKWVGSGDIFLGMMMGAMTGWPGILPALAVSYFIGLIVTGVLLLTGKKSMKDTIPLGPFLAAGTALTLLTPLGEYLRSWYAL